MLVSSAVVLLIVVSMRGEEYSNVASLFELGMGARPLAMGGAFAGLADDANALFYNSAGLAWAQGLSVLSSYEARPGTAGYGHVSASIPHLAFGIHYFDFGDVPGTDEFGNVLGSFSYRNYALIAAAGVKAADLPFFNRMPFANNVGFGISVKLLKVSTLEPGSGSGLALDLPFLFWSESPSSGRNLITGYGFGLVIENLVGLTIKYESGHQESWPRKVLIGGSLELMNQVVLVLDLTSEKSVRLGVEWTPIAAVSFRTGLKNEGLWMWSLGMGVRYRNFAFDYAVVQHPYLNSQLRGSFGFNW